MKEAFEIANRNTSRRKEADQRRWRKRPQLSVLQAGDRVLIKNVVERGGPGKIRSF